MTTAGPQSYFGYEYQFRVSALLMLLAYSDANRGMRFFEVETQFGQDAAIALSKESPDAEKELVVRQESALSDVQIQIKTRGRSREWRPGDLAKILLKQDESASRDNPRTVLDYLVASPTSVLFFITDGVLQPKLTGLLAALGSLDRRRGTASLEECLSSLQHADPALRQQLTMDVLSRVYVYDSLSNDSIGARLRDLLASTFGVQQSEIETKIRALIDRVRDATLRVQPSVITADDLRMIAGEPTLIPYPEAEVTYRATAYGDRATAILERYNILIVSGEPAVGKTTLCRHIANAYTTRGYKPEELRGADAYLEVLRACQGRDSIVFLMDDPFGYDKYDRSLGQALANQLDALPSALASAKGRVKVILSTRQNVFADALAAGRVRSSDGLPYLLALPQPTDDFVQEVLEAHLGQRALDTGAVDSILTALKSDPLGREFENLLHVREFAAAMANAVPSERRDALSIFDKTRPSLYLKWLEDLQPEYQLLLVALWLDQSASQFPYEADLRLLFLELADTANLEFRASLPGPFDRALRGLEKQERILRLGEGRLEFIHPLLADAAKRFFEDGSGLRESIIDIVGRLTAINNPQLQSIAAMLVTSYFHEQKLPLDLFKQVYSSRYLQVRDTFVRFGAHLLSQSPDRDDELATFVEKVFRRQYTPRECEIDARGNIVIKETAADVEGYSVQLSDLDMAWFFDTDLSPEPELVALFERAIQGGAYGNYLNPLQRYKFVNDLARRAGEIERETLARLVFSLAYDPITFVRAQVARRIRAFGAYLGTDFDRLLTTLCLDSSPHVKQEALEAGIVLGWAEAPLERQQRLLKLVERMLDDPILRFQVGPGLIGQSGSLYFYHEDHTKDQKAQWFQALALKLLEHPLRLDRFNRLLDAWQDYYPSCSVSLRVALLRGLDNYLERDPWESVEAARAIAGVALNPDLSAEEHSVLLPLMGRLSADGRAALSFRLARHYSDLPSEALRGYVDRFFYPEEPKQYGLERAAALLGFLSEPSLAGNALPGPVQSDSGDVSTSVAEYIESQGKDFQQLALLLAFGHGWLSALGTLHGKAYLHPVVKELLERFIGGAAGEEGQVLATEIVLRDVYWLLGGEHAEVLEAYLQSVLSLEMPSVAKAGCGMLFALNIQYSVHNWSDALIWLAAYLKHQDQEVRSFARSLFDKHFYTFLKGLREITATQREVPRKAEVLAAWSDNEFRLSLIRDCPMLFQFLKTEQLVGDMFELWRSQDKAQVSELIVEIILKLAGVIPYPALQIIVRFYESISPHLSADQRTAIEGAAYSEDESDGIFSRHLRGFLDHRASEEELRSYLSNRGLSFT